MIDIFDWCREVIGSAQPIHNRQRVLQGDGWLIYIDINVNHYYVFISNNENFIQMLMKFGNIFNMVDNEKRKYILEIECGIKQ